ncbi:hypothetical protein JXB28_05670 [Candidatus Woesearchaeota archaeon]|nr:hypothetical protein [Candidatus Woesearchaeota archaeon]
MVLENITYFQILGKPLIMYGGILTLLLLLFTASIAILNKKGIHTIPFQWHQRMAITTIIFALIHGMLGVLAYF